MSGPAFAALGMPDDAEQSEYSGISESDVKGVVYHLKQSFGMDGNDDFSKLELVRENQFKIAGSMSPWDAIASTEAHESTASFYSRMLASAPRSNIL